MEFVDWAGLKAARKKDEAAEEESSKAGLEKIVILEQDSELYDCSDCYQLAQDDRNSSQELDFLIPVPLDDHF